MVTKGITGASCYPRHSLVLWRNKSNRNKYGTKRANISTVMNGGVEIHCKAVTTQVFTVLCLLGELGIDITKSNYYFEASTSIM